MSNTVPKQTAGQVLYDQIMKRFQAEYDSAKTSMQYAAYDVADKPDDVNKRAKYQVAKARCEQAQITLGMLVDYRGALYQLDKPEQK